MGIFYIREITDYELRILWYTPGSRRSKCWYLVVNELQVLYSYFIGTGTSSMQELGRSLGVFQHGAIEGRRKQKVLSHPAIEL